MKKYLFTFSYLVFAFLFIFETTLRAQTPTAIQVWNFETALGDWVSGPGAASIALSNEKAFEGTQSVKLVKANNALEINFQNDVYEDLKAGDIIKFNIWISTTDLTDVNGFQIYWQTGSGWSWNSQWFNASAVTGDAWTTLEYTMPAIALPLQRIGLQLTAKAGTEAKTSTLYVDNISVTRMIDQSIVSKWGFYGSNNGGWSTSAIGSGTATISGDTLKSTWAILRGGFNTITPTIDSALVVQGTVEFTGAIDSWSALRFGIFNGDSAGVIVDTLASKTFWNGTNPNYNSGYLFAPYSGTNDPISWNAGNPKGNGTHGGLVNRPVNSTNNSDQNYVLGEITPKPVRATLAAGTYKFAISIQPLSNGTSELRFYLYSDTSPVKYWFGGTSIDTTTRKSTKFNSVTFALNNGNANVNARGMNVIDVQVDMGDPIVVPPPPFSSYYISDWGFIGGKMGGWTYTKDAVIGNAAISGSVPNTDWAAVRGGFVESFTPTAAIPLKITGKVQFVGGGFEAANSFRFGVFQSDSAGKVVVDATPADGDSTHWAGSENYNSGYLFIPVSGTNELLSWAGVSTQKGTWGAVVNQVWMNTDGANNYVLGTNLQAPSNAVAGAGTYDFAISITPKADGTSEIRYKLNNGTGYIFSSGTNDIHSPLATNKFNSVAFALNTNPSTTAMKLIDVKVDSGTVTIVGLEASEGMLPTQYDLSQNYPNPFNPSTSIEFALPQSGDVSLVVYDVLGSKVANLIAGELKAGYHKINFDASRLSSGVYFYSLKAGDFVSVKKLMLLK